MFYKIGNILIRVFVKVIHYIFLLLEYILDFLEDKRKSRKGRKNERD